MAQGLESLGSLRYDGDGLVTVVVQDHLGGEIRMVAHANEEAIRLTLATGRATFWSRSRSEIWEKGKTSGNAIIVQRVLADCDGDALIYLADPHGPSCHTGAESCFFREIDGNGAARPTPPAASTLLGRLEAELEARKASTGTKSYTKALYDGGPSAVGAKIEEEAKELVAAIASEDAGRVASEAADLLYHVVVGLRLRGIPLRDVFAVLEARAGTSGHAEKAARGAGG